MAVPLLAALLLLGGVPDKVLDAKVATILPTAQEDRWLQIPWRSSIMRAREEAQSANKPLFFWIMNGHPLGST